MIKDGKFYLDGVEVPVGAMLYDLVYGESFFLGVNERFSKQIHLTTKNLGYFSVNSEGKQFNESCRTLFWSKPEFEIPKPPKRKVKKWRWIVINTFLNNYSITSRHYESALKASQEAYHWEAIQRIDATEEEFEE